MPMSCADLVNQLADQLEAACIPAQEKGETLESLEEIARRVAAVIADREELIEAASGVVAAWCEGDLAGAVNHLEAVAIRCGVEPCDS
jgi:GTPase